MELANYFIYLLAGMRGICISRKLPFFLSPLNMSKEEKMPCRVVCHCKGVYPQTDDGFR